MPEYLAPGVYVEETSFRSKSIEGVSTTTTGFVGPTRFGPVDIQPDVITSLADYELIYGDGAPLNFGSSMVPNFMWHAVRAFFTEGGRRLYVARAIHRTGGVVSAVAATGNLPTVALESDAAKRLVIKARFPGAGGNLRVIVALRYGGNALATINAVKRFSGLVHNDIVVGGSGATFKIYRAQAQPDGSILLFEAGVATGVPASDAALTLVRVVTATVIVASTDGSGTPRVWDGLALDPSHRRNGVDDSLTGKFAATPATLGMARSLPLVLASGADLTDGRAVLAALGKQLTSFIGGGSPTDAQSTAVIDLAGGTDGTASPGVGDYDGTGTPAKTGLELLEDIEDISIVAAPGATANNDSTGDGVTGALLAHCSKMRYRIAVIDAGRGLSVGDARTQRAKFDSTYAAFYYPWVTVIDPYTNQEINLPPSGFVAGIYARNDIVRAVYKAPANEPVNLAVGFERLVNRAEQEVLNPEGVNCFRFFEGRGFRLWGARTMSSDPEWKYVNLRRYFAYLERSIDKGTQWAVFEPNGEALWANVRRTVEDFLLNEWTNGALLGDKPEKAYFVRCDRSTMTQNDLDNGRLVCLIGVAPLRPAEFVIFRIGQWTGDRRA